jgi:8-amino-7-oxononanoate synthase
MTADPRALARELLARAGATPGAGAGVRGTNGAGAPAAGLPPAAGVRAGAGSGARRPGARPRLEDLPQVRQSLARDRFLADGMAGLGRPSPYYREHRGINGATIHLDGQDLVNYSSYNYLGLAGHPRMVAAAKAAIDEYGTTCGATRIVSGNIRLHEEFEAKIAAAYEAEDAIMIGSGFLANASAIAFVLGERDLALCDALVHNSIVAGTLWSHCQRMQFRHNDPEALEGVLSRTRGHFEQVLVILEGVYSMDGDICRLPELVEVARRYDCLVMVDEAHSFAVLGETGRGVREHFGLPTDAVDLWMGTLSKSLASHGGFLAGSHEFIQACRMSAPGMSLYAAGPAPATTAAASTALDIVRDEPERLERLRRNGELMLAAARRAGLDTGPAEGTPIVPVMLGTTERAVTAAVLLADRGVNVNPITYPAVPEGEARLRFFLSSEHTPEQIEHTVDLLAGIVATAL